MVHHTPIIGTSHTKKWYITHQHYLNIVMHQLLISRFRRRNSYTNYINNRIWNYDLQVMSLIGQDRTT